MKQSRALGRSKCLFMYICLFHDYSIVPLLVVVVGGILRILALFVQLSSSSNRFGCICEPNNKHPKTKDSRFRVSISERPSDLLGQRTYTHTHP
jgi:hypothetical protein